jgi:hypothetical protein
VGADKVRKNAENVRTTKAVTTRTAHENIAKVMFSQPARDVPSGDSIRFGDFRELSSPGPRPRLKLTPTAALCVFAGLACQGVASALPLPPKFRRPTMPSGERGNETLDQFKGAMSPVGAAPT